MISSSLIARLLHPSRRMLVLFGVLLSPFITYGLWRASFIVSASFIYLYEMIIGAGLAVWLLFFVIDRFLSDRLLLTSRLRSYPIAGVIAFVALMLVEFPVHWTLQYFSDKDGDLIRASVESYREHNGVYPEDLTDSAFDDLPRSSWTGSTYIYSRDIPPYKVEYASIGGRERFYSHQYKAWTFPFDE